MPKLNIDEMCEPIVIVVGKKEYTVEDIPRDMAIRMQKLGEKAEKDGDIGPLADLMAEVLGADKADIAKLGMRKLTMLVRRFMDVITVELEGKNVPKAVVTK